MKYSIIIPVKKNPKGLEITLNSLQRDPSLSEHEIIVANDDADTKVSKVVEALKNDGTPISEVLIKESKGAYYARNRAIEKAKGETYIFFDDEMELPLDWFKRLCPVIQEYDYIAGKVVIAKKDNESIFEKYYRLNAFPFEEYFKKYKFGGAGFLVVKKKVFEEVGLFEESMVSGVDIDFGIKVHDKQFKTFYFDKYAAIHQSKAFLKQIKTTIRDLRGAYGIYQLYPDRFRQFNITSFSIAKSTLNLFLTLFMFKNNKIYKTGEFSLLEFILVHLVNGMIRIGSQIIIKLFPNSKFNY